MDVKNFMQKVSPRPVTNVEEVRGESIADSKVIAAATEEPKRVAFRP